MRIAVAFIAAAIAFAVIDAIWIINFVGPWLRDAAGHLLADQFALTPAIVFYVLHLSGMTYFAIAPALRDGAMRTAARNGFLFGLFCYQTYEMTNLATLDGWPEAFAVVDTLWGGVLTATCAAVGYLAATAVPARRAAA